MPETIELWGVSDPNISAQLALACKLDLFKREAGLDVSCKFIESGTTMADDVFNAEKKACLVHTDNRVFNLGFRDVSAAYYLP